MEKNIFIFFKKLAILAAILSIIFMFAIFATGCKDKDKNSDGDNEENKIETPTDEDLIKDRIKKFMTAYNDGDMEEAMIHLAAKPRNAFNAILNLLGSLAGSASGVDIDLRDLFSLGIAIEDGDYMRLKINKIEIVNSQKAIATTIMTLANSDNKTIYFEMVYEHDGWYINDMTDKKPSVSNSGDGNTENCSSGSGDSSNDNSGEGTQTSIEIDSLYPVGGGVTCVFYYRNAVLYSSLINSNGEIFYSQTKSAMYSYLGNDTFLEEYSNVIINKEGNQIKLDESLYDEIKGYGDGLILVYKDTTNISKTEHSYGVINANDGTWEQPLRSLNSETALYNQFNYMGDGIWNNDNVFYDSKTGASFRIEYAAFSGDTFKDGKIYGRQAGDWYTPQFHDYHDAYNSVDMSEYFVLYSDGTYAEATIEDFYKNNTFITIEYPNDSEYMKVIAPDGTGSYYLNLKSELIDHTIIFGDYIFIRILGKDNKNYLTVVDMYGTQQFEPIPFYYNYFNSNLILSSDIIVYETADYIYEAIDIEGNKIISADKNYIYLEYKDGIFVAREMLETGNYIYHILDENGNEIKFDLTK